MTRPPPARLALAILFSITGALHFLAAGSFVRIVPAWVPWPALVVAMSGVAELAGAAGLLTSRFSRSAGCGLILLLVAVFPANVHMLELARSEHSSAGYQALLWLRLPLQPLLIWWVWRAAVRRRRANDVIVPSSA